MIARKIKPEEVKRTEELFSVSFDSPYDNVQAPLELYNNYITAPKSREQEHCLERFAAFEDDDRTMMSSFIMQPFDIRFDNYTASMFSIGGVATLPQYRRRGGIKACFHEALHYMYEQGAAFSYLYPFSTSYYRKFGYEICCERQLYHVALAHIPVYPITGRCYLLEASTAVLAAKDIPYVYEQWQTKYNMMTANTKYDYSFIESASPYKEQTFTYVYRSSGDKALAYMTFRCNTGSKHRKLECSSFFYTNTEGLQGLLTLAKGFASDYRHISFSLPSEQFMYPVLPEWSMGAVSREVFHHGMVRVINVKQVLANASYIGDGSLVLEITDPHIPENNGIFQTTFSNGQCTNITVVSEQPDITLSISAFSALITGGYDACTIPMWENVSIHNNTETLKKVFYKKPVYITALF